MIPTLTPNQYVTWLYTPRGGYGFTTPVKAQVVEVHAKRICIRIWNRYTGEEYYRHVTPDKLVAGEGK